METKKSTWEVLSKVDCNKHTEKKNGLTYLSWAWAWSIVKATYPNANYEVISFEGKPYLFDEHLGYLVQTKVTIDGETIGMQLPVMNGANKAQKHIVYKYSVKGWQGKPDTIKEVDAATMFDINTTMMRCLTKNLAMFGLGMYIYAGEDLPQQLEAEVTTTYTAPKPSLDDAKKAFDSVGSRADFVIAMKEYKEFLQNSEVSEKCKALAITYPKPEPKQEELPITTE